MGKSQIKSPVSNSNILYSNQINTCDHDLNQIMIWICPPLTAQAYNTKLFCFDPSSTPSSSPSSCSNPGPLVNLSRGVFHSCLKTFLFSESYTSIPSRLSLPQTDLLKFVAGGVQEQAQDVLVPPLLWNCLTEWHCLFPVTLFPPV